MSESEATIRFVHTVGEGASNEQLNSIAAYHEELAEVCTVVTEGEVITTDDEARALLSAAETADLLVMSTSAHRWFYDVVFGPVPDQLVENAQSTVLLTHSQAPRRYTFIRHLLNKYVF